MMEYNISNESFDKNTIQKYKNIAFEKMNSISEDIEKYRIYVIKFIKKIIKSISLSFLDLCIECGNLWANVAKYNCKVSVASLHLFKDIIFKNKSYFILKYYY